MKDCFKTLHPREEGFTWFSGDSTRASRIDYIFTRDCQPTDAKLTPLFFSDHAMLSYTIDPVFIDPRYDYRKWSVETELLPPGGQGGGEGVQGAVQSMADPSRLLLNTSTLVGHGKRPD